VRIRRGNSWGAAHARGGVIIGGLDPGIWPEQPSFADPEPSGKPYATANVQKKPFIALSRSMAYHAELQHAIAEMAIELDGIGPHIKRIAQDWSDRVD
jgi:hypothetical protein